MCCKSVVLRAEFVNYSIIQKERKLLASCWFLSQHVIGEQANCILLNFFVNVLIIEGFKTALTILSFGV